MSAKSDRHTKKMAMKKAKKAAKKAYYASLAGTSKKKKRQKKKHGPSNHKHAHIMLNCGNVGCDKCFPKF